MPVLYKDNRVLYASQEQVPLLEKDGWSSTKPAPVAQTGKATTGKPAQNAATTPVSGSSKAASDTAGKK